MYGVRLLNRLRVDSRLRMTMLFSRLHWDRQKILSVIDRPVLKPFCSSQSNRPYSWHMQSLIIFLFDQINILITDLCCINNECFIMFCWFEFVNVIPHFSVSSLGFCFFFHFLKLIITPYISASGFGFFYTYGFFGCFMHSFYYYLREVLFLLILDSYLFHIPVPKNMFVMHFYFCFIIT